MENPPNHEATQVFEELLDLRINSILQHPENLISVEELLQRGWDCIEKAHPKNLQG